MRITVGSTLAVLSLCLTLAGCGTQPDDDASGGGMGGVSGGAALGEGGAGGSPSQPSSAAERRRLLTSSRASWTTLKTARGDNYEYMREKTVYPFGGTHQTRIEVRGGVVVRRSLGSKTTPTWIETGATLGTHEGGYLAPAITIDELYNRCETQILTKDETSFTLTLTTHPDGVINVCQAWPRGCQDDCGIGYEITEYEFLK